MTTLARLAVCLALAAPTAPFALAADAPVVIERAPDADQSAAQAEAGALRRENEQLKARLSASEAAKALSETSLQESTQQLATLRAKVARLEKPATEAAALIAAEKARADEATRRLELLTPTVGRLSQEKAALETQLAATRELPAKLAEAERLLATIQADNDLLKTASADQVRLAAEVEQLRREKAAAENAAKTSPDLTAKLADTEEKLATALRSYSLLQTETDQLKAAAATQTNLAADLEKARQENATLAAKLAAVPPDQSAALAAQLAATEAKLATTLTSFSQLQAEHQRLQSTAGDQATLTAEIEKLRRENAELTARLATPPPVAAPATAEPSPDLANRLADAESKLSTVLRSYSLLQAENDQLKAGAATAADQAQAAAAKNTAEATAQITALREELRQTQARGVALATENAELKTRLALVGPPPGTTLAAPLRPGTAAATSALHPVEIPTETPAPAAPRTHLVVAGDNLAKIARQYYGNANRWDEILRANRDVIKNENVLPLGATLRIP